MPKAHANGGKEMDTPIKRIADAGFQLVTFN